MLEKSDMDISWARGYTNSSNKGKIHVVVGEGIYMYALCRKHIALVPDIVTDNRMKRIDKVQICKQCLRILDEKGHSIVTYL